MNYQEQLLQPEWTSKRLEILERDGYRCKMCQKERPFFRGLVRSFGTPTLKELVGKGYELIIPTDTDLTYSNLSFRKDGRRYRATFVGDESQEFNLEKLLFGLQCVSAETVFGTQRSCCLLSFYPETINGQNLIDLHVHHKYYIIGNKAWEYNNEALVSLCADCHKQTHAQYEISVYNKRGDKLYITETCDRCNGAGYLQEYDYYLNGVCFQCWGEGVINIDKAS